MHKNSFTYFQCYFFFFFFTFETLAGYSEVKVGQVLAMHIQHHQTCYTVLAMISGDRFFRVKTVLARKLSQPVKGRSAQKKR